MIKVSDVKKIMGEGFEFVEGDLIDGTTGDPSSRSIDIIHMKSIAIAGTGGYISDEWTMREFAPRPNTGEQPVGDDVWVDVEFSNGSQHFGVTIQNWTIGGAVYVISWKPCMKWLTEQSNFKTEEEIQAMGKPVFTKEMADANIKPLAGMEVIVINCGNNNGEALVKFCSDDYLIVDHPSDCGSEQHYHMSSVEIKPIPTERDKAIADMKDAIKATEYIAHEVAIESIGDICGALYDAGYRKEVK